MNKLAAEVLNAWPTPPDNPTDALKHVLSLFDDTPDDDFVVVATSGIYGPGVRTGLTWGDLRAIAAKGTR